MTKPRNPHVIAGGLLVLASCTSGPSFIAGFRPPPVELGYTRFVLPTVTDIEPGANALYCQWAEAPQDHDRQIVATTGFQSLGGHHVALYATGENQPVGTSRPCTTDDMLAVTFVGAVGAEGLQSAPLPAGMAFTVPKGYALMTNTHYLNETDATFDGQSVIDVKFGDPAHPEHSVGSVAINNDQFTLPPNTISASDGYCQAPSSMSLFMWANHMHQWGASVSSELIRADGTHVPLAQDATWQPEQTFNPSWVMWDVASPMVVQQGDTFHVHCQWNNTTPNPITFPTEMCVATGFTLEAMPMSVCETTPTP